MRIFRFPSALTLICMSFLTHSCLRTGEDLIENEDLIEKMDNLAGDPVEVNTAPCASSEVGCPDLDFVTIQGGTFQMGSGSSYEQPIHSVTLVSFEIMRSEITLGQYRLCVNAGVCSVPRSSDPNDNWSSSAGSKEDHPINCVS